MCEIRIPMKFKVDFNSEEDYQSVFDSLVDNGLVSSFSAMYILSRVLDEKCKDGVYYFTVTKNIIFGIYVLDSVSKDEYDNLDYNIYSYHQNQWILYTDDSNLHSDAMLLTHSTELVSNEPKEILIHENDLTEMKIKIKNDEEFMILQQYFFNRGVGWLEFGGDKQFVDNADTSFPIKYIYIVAEDEKFYMVTGYTDEVFESSTYPLGIFDVLKVIK